MVKLYCVQLVSALGHLHEKGVMYRDLQPGNVLVRHSGHIKLIDFGLSKFIDKSRNTVVGAPEYIAPEMIQGHKAYSYSVDWWSLGILTYQLVVGFAPFVANYDDWQSNI